MNRCGVESELVPKLIEVIDSSPNLKLAGIYTHFATADESDLSFAYEQLAVFNDRENSDIVSDNEFLYFIQACFRFDRVELQAHILFDGPCFQA